jgi:hypothetical protein
MNFSANKQLKGTVQRELWKVKIGVNRTAMKICFAGKCRLPCPKGHHHERSINILGALFDAIPTGWVSRHNSVGLIPLQHRCSDAVAAQRRSIPKCSVKSSGGQISTFIPSIQIFDFYSIGRLPYLHFFLKVELKVNACNLRFSVR